VAEVGGTKTPLTAVEPWYIAWSQISSSFFILFFWGKTIPWNTCRNER